MVAIAIALLLVLGLYTWGILAGPAASLASHEMHRRVHIDRFSAHLLRATPTVTINGLTVANPAWAKGPYLARIRSITFGIEPWQLLRARIVLSRLQIDDPDIDLQRDAQGRENWDFSPTPAKPAQAPTNATVAPPRLPAVKLFTMNGGSVQINDAIRHLQFQGAVAANENAAHPEHEPLRVQGHGELNGKPFQLIFSGSALFNLQLDKPYNFNSSITAGPLSVLVQGEIDRPFDFAHFGASLQVKGQNLAGLYYLTGLALPFTPPFAFSSRMRNDAETFTLRDIRATVGQSDVEGDMRVQEAGTRPLLTANLHSRLMSLSDLAPSIGAGVPAGKSGKSGQADLEAPNPNKTAYGVLPTYRFDFQRLRKMDARVQLQADAIKTSMPIKQLQLDLALQNGQLALDPLQLTLPLGALSGVVRVDAHGSEGIAALDLRLRDIDLSQFKPAAAPQSPVAGTLLARVQLKGRGSSVHDILGTSNGLFTVVVPHGAVRKSFAELAGVNVAKGLGLLLSKSQQQATIRCAVAAFAVRQGVAHVQQLVFSTDAIRVTGRGDINFNNERLDLTIQGHPKHFQLLHLYVPVVVDGTLSKPSFGVKPGGLLAQAGAAAALGVLATPAASLLAFVDPGLTKNVDCNALLANPQARTAVRPGPPHASPKAPAPKAPPAPSKHLPTEPKG